MKLIRVCRSINVGRLDYIPMAQLQYTNLPKGFGYPLTKKEIREFIAKSEIEFETIEFSGLSSSEHYYSKKAHFNTHFVVYLDAKRNDIDWCFKVGIKGLKIERFENRREEIAQALLVQIENWVTHKLKLQLTASERVSRASLAINLQDKNILSIQVLR